MNKHSIRQKAVEISIKELVGELGKAESKLLSIQNMIITIRNQILYKEKLKIRTGNP